MLRCVWLFIDGPDGISLRETEMNNGYGEWVLENYSYRGILVTNYSWDETEDKE